MATSDPYALPPQATGPGVRNVATVQLNDGTNNVDSQLITVVDSTVWSNQQRVLTAPPTGNEGGAVTRSIPAGCNQAIVTAQVTCGTTDTQLSAASPNQYRRLVKVTPVGQTIFIGPSGVTGLTGYIVADGSEAIVELGPGLNLHGCSPAGSCTVYVMELA